MTEEDYLEFRFVQAELKKHGMEIRDIMISTIEAKSLISASRYSRAEVEKHLRERISFQVSKEGENGGKLHLWFADYGRFIEIRYRKYKTRKRLVNRADTVEMIHGIKSRSRMVAYKDTSWYNSSAYGTLYNLIGRLSYGYTEATRLDLKRIFIDPYKPA